jgi:hypothetical protein
MFYQQQSQLTKIDVGFCDAEKFATAMTIEVVPKILGLLCRQTSRLGAVERSLQVEYHQKVNATYMLKENERMEAVGRSLVEYLENNNGAYQAIMMKDNEHLQKLDRKLDNLSGEMDQLKLHVSRILVKLNKIANNMEIGEDQC